MTILRLDRWMDRLRETAVSGPRPVRSGQSLAQQGGTAQIVQSGPALWRVTLTIGEMPVWMAREHLGLIDRAQQPETAVEVMPKPHHVQMLDEGARTAAMAATVDSVSADGWSLTIAGAPTEVLEGDWIGVSWAVGSDEAQRLYHVAEAAAATAAGLLGPVRVQPRLDAAVPAGASVKLHRPTMLMLVAAADPDDLSGAKWGGASIDLVQTTRAITP